jgi:hypothetical protein
MHNKTNLIFKEEKKNALIWHAAPMLMGVGRDIWVKTNTLGVHGNSSQGWR